MLSERKVCRYSVVVGGVWCVGGGDVFPGRWLAERYPSGWLTGFAACRRRVHAPLCDQVTTRFLANLQSDDSQNYAVSYLKYYENGNLG